MHASKQGSIHVSLLIIFLSMITSIDVRNIEMLNNYSHPVMPSLLITEHVA